jgi:hypothetical protein
MLFDHGQHLTSVGEANRGEQASAGFELADESCQYQRYGFLDEHCVE